MPRRRLTAALASLLVAAAATPADAVPPPGNRLVNSGAEAPGLEGWQGSGFASPAYGTAPGYPTLADAEAHFYGDGTHLFAATTSNAQITQKVELSDLGASIDAGQQPTLWFGGDFGAPGGAADTTQLVVQLLGGGGTPIGGPQVVGAPTAADRGNQTTLLPCIGSVRAPQGTRAVQVSLQALGPPGINTAMADALFVTSQPVAFPAVDDYTVPAQGPGCRTRVRRSPPAAGASSGQTAATVPQRVPKLTSLLVLPQPRRCGKPRMLRFRVADSWRSKVQHVSITARGRQVQIGPRRTTALDGPRRRLLVRFSVKLKDGRSRTGVRRYVNCGGG